MEYVDVMDALKGLARRRGWTQPQLAEAVGLSTSGLKKSMNADDGSFARVDALCGVLGVSLSEVLELVAASPGPWRLTEEQERLFREHPACWGFLCDLSAAGWDPAGLPDAARWLVRLERRGVLRVTEGGKVVPLDAARRPWQGGADFGDAVIRPLQDEVLARARSEVREGRSSAVECGYARLRLSEQGTAQLKAALREVVATFGARSRREATLGLEVAPVGVLTVSCPLEG